MLKRVEAEGVGHSAFMQKLHKLMSNDRLIGVHEGKIRRG